MQTPDVSIIIPIYNAAEYLSRCLESARAQTLASIEIICVNDASADASGIILRKHSAEDPRIRVISLDKNVGESAARNIGLREARGRYIGSIDNDDVVDLNFFGRLYEVAARKNADIVKGNCLEIDAVRGSLTRRNINEDVRRNKMCFSYQWWTAIYRRRLLLENHISFPEELCLGGDLVFLLKALIAARSVETVDEVFYYYYRRSNSGDSNVLGTRKVDSVLNAYGQVFTLLNENYPARLTREEYDHFYGRYLMILVRNIRKRSQRPDDKKKCAEAAIRFIDSCRHPEMLFDLLKEARIGLDFYPGGLAGARAVAASRHAGAALQLAASC